MMAKFDKAKEKAKAKKNWGRIEIGQYQVCFWAIPLLPFYHFWEKFKNWKYNRLTWNEERATKVLDKILWKKLEWIEEDKAFYYCMGWSPRNLWRYAPRTDRAWTEKFSRRLHEFILNGYENAEYIKTVEKDWDETWVKFSEK